MVAYAGRDGVVEVQCRSCGRFVDVYVNVDDFNAWQDGELIQNAFPYLSADEREILISRTCGPCFDKMFGGNEDEE